MIDVYQLYELIKNEGIGFFTGVPDSYLNRFCNLMTRENCSNHIIAANEGNAIAIASGHYFATGEMSLVYMQNSGLGNAVNPLLSLADKNVYGVPMLLLIGWRGQPGTGDWVQHDLQGRVTIPFLDIMGIANCVLNEETYREDLIELINTSKATRTPVAVVVPHGELDGDKSNNIDDLYPLSRREAMEIVMNTLPHETIFLATTGRTTRELFYLRKDRGESIERDFLNVGAMGHTLSVAVGMALARPNRNFAVFDGDAASIMHMGGMAIAAGTSSQNLLHIVLNNGSHESVGGQPSAGYKIDLTLLAKSLGFETIDSYVSSEDQIVDAINRLKERKKAGFLEIRICKGMKKKLPPLEYDHKEAIMNLMMEMTK